MNVIKSIIIAFSMFSKIPMPLVKWEEENMKYVFCFLPFIGIVIGVVELLWFMAVSHFEMNSIIFGAVATLIPVALTGGIHIDGFMDTCDALGSHRDKEKMLEILDDSRVGAFAMLGSILYFLIFFGAMTMMNNMWQIKMCVVLFFASRALASFVVISNNTAKQSGLLYTFKEGANNIVVGLFSVIYILMSMCGFEMFNIGTGMITIIILFVFTIYFIIFVARKFGGISGDLIGWFISMAEVLALLVIGLGGVLS